MATVKVFMGGDVFGSTGIETVTKKMPLLKEKYSPDFIIWNGENASGGNGLLECDATVLFSSGIDVITGGNHIFEKRDSYPLLNTEKRILRPENYSKNVLEILSFMDSTIEKDKTDTTEEHSFPAETPGKGFFVYKKNGVSYGVLNVQGRESMTPLDCPFKVAQKTALTAAEENALFFVDFHAESNEEKEALALFLDGHATALCGTHTHVQTADERILPKGTAYITDLGMTGAVSSAIGSKPEIAVKRNLTQVLYKMENEENEFTVQGVLITADTETKKAIKIERIVL